MALFAYTSANVIETAPFFSLQVYENNFAAQVIMVKQILFNAAQNVVQPDNPAGFKGGLDWASMIINQNQINIKDIVISRQTDFTLDHPSSSDPLQLQSLADAPELISTDMIFIGVGTRNFNIVLNTLPFTEFYTGNFYHYKYMVSPGSTTKGSPGAIININTRPNYFNFMLYANHSFLADVTDYKAAIETLYTPFFPAAPNLLQIRDVYNITISGVFNPLYVKKTNFEQGLPDEVIQARKKRRGFIPASVRRRLKTRKKG